MVYKRPSWDEYFMKIVDIVGLRSTCDRGRAGCVIVKNNHILSIGYVGSPPGLPHCDEIGHLIIKSTEEGDNSGKLHDHCVRTIHAEQNAICHAARMGVALEGATLYVKMEPCPVCCHLIIAVGIKRVVCQYKYHTAKQTRDLFRQAKIQLVVLENKEVEYKK